MWIMCEQLSNKGGEKKVDNKNQYNHSPIPTAKIPLSPHISPGIHMQNSALNMTRTDFSTNPHC